MCLMCVSGNRQMFRHIKRRRCTTILYSYIRNIQEVFLYQADDSSEIILSLRERRGLVYNVESNLTSYTDTGAFCIYFGTDVDDMDTCLKLTYKELKRMRDVKMTSSQLAAAKKQLIGQIGVASDNFENNALGMAKTYLHYHKYESSELVFKRIEELTAEQLLEVANEMFAEEYLSTLIYK